MAIVEKSVLVHFSTQQMFDLVRAVGDYPLFLPWCSAGRVEPIEFNVEKATIEMAFKGLKQQFCTLNKLTPGHQIEMTLLDGPFSHLEGSWQFHQLTPHACKVHFQVEYQFSSHLLQKWVAPVFTSLMNNLVDSFIKRAEVLHNAKGRE